MSTHFHSYPNSLNILVDCKFQLDTFLVIFLYQQGSNDLWDKVLAFYCHLHHPHNGSVLDMLNRQQDQLCCCESNKYKKVCKPM